MYEVIGVPPLEVGASQVTSEVVLPAVVTTERGASGLVATTPGLTNSNLSGSLPPGAKAMLAAVALMADHTCAGE